MFYIFDLLFQRRKRTLYNEFITNLESDSFCYLLNDIEFYYNNKNTETNRPKDAYNKIMSETFFYKNEKSILVLFQNGNLNNKKYWINFWIILPFLKNFSLKDLKSICEINIIKLEDLEKYLNPIIYFAFVSFYKETGTKEQSISLKNLYEIIIATKKYY